MLNILEFVQLYIVRNSPAMMCYILSRLKSKNFLLEVFDFLMENRCRGLVRLTRHLFEIVDGSYQTIEGVKYLIYSIVTLCLAKLA